MMVRSLSPSLIRTLSKKCKNIGKSVALEKLYSACKHDDTMENLTWDMFLHICLNDLHDILRLVSKQIKVIEGDNNFKQNRGVGRGNRAPEVTEWKCVRPPPLPSHSPVNEKELRAFRSQELIYLVFAAFPRTGLRLSEFVTFYERILGIPWPRGVSLTTRFQRCMQADGEALSCTRQKNHDDIYAISHVVRNGLMLKRLMVSYPQGLSWEDLKEAWIEKYGGERPPPLTLVSPSSVDSLVNSYIHFARIVFVGGESDENLMKSKNFDQSLIRLYPKYEPSQLAKIRIQSDVKYDFHMLTLEDKIDWVLSKYSNHINGMNICDFVDEFELTTGYTLPFHKSLFEILSKLRINYDAKSPSIFTTLFPSNVLNKFRDLLSDFGSEGLKDTDLSDAWKTKFDEKLKIPNNNQFKRATILFDRFYNEIKVLRNENGDDPSPRYVLRNKSFYRGDRKSGELSNVRENVRNLLKTENDGKGVDWLEFVDIYTSKFGGKPFPTGRSLRRMVTRCGKHKNEIQFAEDDEKGALFTKIVIRNE